MFSSRKSSAPAAGGYNLTKSLRFRSSANAYLNRTFGSPTNNNKWTWSGWVKRGALGTDSGLFGAWRTTIGVVQCYFMSNNTLRLYVNDDTNTTYLDYQTSAVYRDPSAWYHVVISIDNTLATTSALIYINGTQVTAFGTNTNTLVQNAGLAWNFNGSAGYIGQNRNTSNAAFGYFDGYLAEVNFIDGQQLTPSSFGQTSTTTGVWIPKKYTGTYGNNGFYLDFEDTSSTAALGYDAAGSNDWTVNNISLTAGSTYDSMNDVPTLTDATTANYCVLNPLDKGTNNTLSNGNLRYAIAASTQGIVRATFGLPSTGKWYCEATKIAAGNLDAGIATRDAAFGNYLGEDANGWGYFSADGKVYNNNVAVATGATLADGDVLGIAFNSDTGTLQFYKNGALETTTTGFTPSTVQYFFAAGSSAGDGDFNFGQQPFAQTPPTGFVALNTFNISAGTITTSGSFTGNSSTDGPFIYLNGVPTAMTINGNSVTFGTDADKLSNGFKVRSSSSSYNTSGSNTYSISTTSDKFKFANAQPNP